MFLAGLFLVLSSYAQTFSVNNDSVLQNAGYSVYAFDALSGKVIYSTQQVSLVPASVMKIVTTATALEVLGPDYKFITKIGYTGNLNPETGTVNGNLVIKGGCDPAFYSSYFQDHYKETFENWCTILSKAGIRSINGDLLIDLSAMQGMTIPGGWPWEDIANYYGAGVSAFSYSDNLYKILFSSPKETGKPVKINSIIPGIDSLVITNRVVSSSINKDNSVFLGAPGSFHQMIEGTIPAGQTDFEVKGAMPDPAKIAVWDFIKVLKFNKITFTGRIVFDDLSPVANFIPLAEKASPSLSELIVPLNHESVNLFAEHLLREIGRARKGSSTLDNSLAALNDFWKEKQIFLRGFYPTDGSGLSRSNGITPRTIAEILRTMYLGTHNTLYFNSLPIAGKSGTLQYSFKGTKLEGNLKGKTGSMTRVRCLAGIFTNKAGRKVIFAVMTNNFNGTQTSVGKEIEKLLCELYLM